MLIQIFSFEVNKNSEIQYRSVVVPDSLKNDTLVRIHKRFHTKILLKIFINLSNKYLDMSERLNDLAVSREFLGNFNKLIHVLGQPTTNVAAAMQKQT